MMPKHFFTPDESDKYRRSCARCGRDMTADIHHRSLGPSREELHTANQMKYANAAIVAEVGELLDCVQEDGTISGLDEFEHAEYDTLATVLRGVLSELDRRQRAKPINVIFDGPPSHEAGRFVEVEDDSGKGMKVGEWIDRGDGMWALRITELPEGGLQ